MPFILEVELDELKNKTALLSQKYTKIVFPKSFLHCSSVPCSDFSNEENYVTLQERDCALCSKP